MLLMVCSDSMAARVEYQHPELSIFAEEESLDSVLTAVGKAMQITVTVPLGINPVVNCEIKMSRSNRPSRACWWT